MKEAGRGGQTLLNEQGVTKRGRWARTWGKRWLDEDGGDVPAHGAPAAPMSRRRLPGQALCANRVLPLTSSSQPQPELEGGSRDPGVMAKDAHADPTQKGTGHDVQSEARKATIGKKMGNHTLVCIISPFLPSQADWARHHPR